MPHVEIKCFPGRTEEQKKKCAEKIAEDIADVLGCPVSCVSVVIKEVPKEEWKEKVWDMDIVPNEKYLYKKPVYRELT
ncbi:MAG TPA: 4-oxalocrotonate tautomerase [Clostridiaceae bacterium]|nr:4-oxalocrotonate tautomerase [Clostridiaceae bacterium]